MNDNQSNGHTELILFVVVLDANVLIPGTLRDILLRLAKHRLYQAYWTDEILEEVRRNVLKTRNAQEATVNRIIEVMKRRYPQALLSLESYQPFLEIANVNLKDRHVFAAALACEANMIITANLKDFPDAVLSQHNIKAQSPDVFLANQFAQTPNKIVELLKEQAASKTKPPQTINDEINRLKKTVPNFATRVEVYLKENG